MRLKVVKAPNLEKVELQVLITERLEIFRSLKSRYIVMTISILTLITILRGDHENKAEDTSFVLMLVLGIVAFVLSLFGVIRRRPVFIISIEGILKGNKTIAWREIDNMEIVGESFQGASLKITKTDLSVDKVDVYNIDRSYKEVCRILGNYWSASTSLET